MADTNNTHGTPSWIEHSGADPKAARKFYEDLLGWTIGEMPMKDGSTYPAIMVGEKPIGGFPPVAGEGGWLLYITVDDVDERAAKAKAAGARIVREPMTAPGVGRMTTIADPFGAQIAFIDYSKA